MELYLIRHAEAVPRGKNDNVADEDRPLTPNGESQARAVASGLQRKGVALQAILTSPLLRARQTVEGMLKTWSGTAPEVRVCEELSPGTKARKLAKALRGLDLQQVALVGHEPDMSAWAAWVIGSKKAQLALAKAGVAHISFPGGAAKGSGTLVQLLTPDWFV